MTFKYLGEEMINKLITSLMQPKLQYAAVIWSPHKTKRYKEASEITKSSYKNGSKAEKFTL